MEEKISVPYIVYEGAQARQERTVKRLVAVIILAVLMLFASNAVWIWAWSQYEVVAEDYDYEYSQDGRGINIIGNLNEVNHGAEVENPSQGAEVGPEE